MEILIKREWLTGNSSIGEMYVNGTLQCFTLEDTDRGLNQSMTLAQVAALKQYGKTAIPKGRYQVILQYSEKHQRVLPLLLNVTDYEGVEIHPGNTAIDTLGCILVGTSRGTDAIYESRKAFTALFAKLQDAANKHEKIFISIQ